MSNKKKKGRPIESPMPRDSVIGIRMNDTEVKCLSDYAWRYEMSMSEVVRQSLELLSIIPVNYLRE